MRIDAGKCITVYLLCGVLAVNCSSFQKYVQTFVAKVNGLLGVEPCDDDAPTAPILDNGEPVVTVPPQCTTTTGEKYHLLGIDWRNVSFKIANNWWIIIVSSLLPFVVLWRIQYLRQRFQEWKKLLVQKERVYQAHSRRLTLPDLTLAKHARRKSMAECTKHLTDRHRRVPSGAKPNGILQFRSQRKNSFERDEDSSGEIKRVHKIRRH